jgi:hypothetical protein
MKSVFLLSPLPNIFRSVADILRTDATCSTREAEDVLQLVDSDGRLLTVFAHTNEETAWEYRDGPFILSDGSAHEGHPRLFMVLWEHARCSDLFPCTVRGAGGRPGRASAR